MQLRKPLFIKEGFGVIQLNKWKSWTDQKIKSTEKLKDRDKTLAVHGEMKNAGIRIAG